MKRLKKPPRILLGLTVLWSVVFAITFSDTGVAFPIFMVMAAAFLVVGVLWAVRAGIFLANSESRGRAARSQLLYWISVPSIFAVAFLLQGTNTLLMARVYLSTSALVHSEPTNGQDDRWVGLFHVRESYRFDREVRFLTSECGLVDTCGIIFSPSAPPAHRGEDFFTHLYGPWWHWYQSW